MAQGWDGLRQYNRKFVFLCKNTKFTGGDKLLRVDESVAGGALCLIDCRNYVGATAITSVMKVAKLVE